MPIYEYQCQACNYEFEKLQKISESAPLQCPQCQQAALKKKVSAAGFRLSGGGWYETDFKSGNKKNLASDDKGGGKGEVGGDKKADSTASAKAAPAESKTKPNKATD